jgi:hypothetical protein
MLGGEFDISHQAPAAPLFFLSYAHSQRRESNPYVARLFDDLSMHVNEMVPYGNRGDPGFMDRSMGGGERWSRELLTAAGTCQVFVALISGPYVASVA